MEEEKKEIKVEETSSNEETFDYKAYKKRKKAEEAALLAEQWKKEKEERARLNREARLVIEHEKFHSGDDKFPDTDDFVIASHLNKVYSNKIRAVKDFSLNIKKGEFVVLVGPSGCGKSTTLRMIAGLEDITSGDLYIDGNYANKLDPKDRGVSMVFQSYALYPHLSVYENMAFGLGGLGKEEVKARIKEAAEMLQITEYLDRKPTQLSGGQCQRVALGRAVVRHAKLFLLDEPLSNLDAKLRVQMRSELVKLHEDLQNTMIYVTHDQTEAMTMATRIVVLKDGVIQQIGSPKEVYDHPSNLFVATFMGSPTMNVIKCHYKDGLITMPNGDFIQFDDELKAKFKKAYNRVEKSLMERRERDIDRESGDVLFDFDADLDKVERFIRNASNFVIDNEGDIYLGIRPEDVTFDVGEHGDLNMKVEVSELLGAEYSLHYDLAGQDFVARVPAKQMYKAGDAGGITFKRDQIHIFDVESGNLVF
ncbi:MAG: ATP-binding cassette domain-containing protein [Bacilli bacterium]|nr:ATP-binding cassette domain-containing protein [Bacilli bacterium]